MIASRLHRTLIAALAGVVMLVAVSCAVVAACATAIERDDVHAAPLVHLRFRYPPAPERTDACAPDPCNDEPCADAGIYAVVGTPATPPPMSTPQDDDERQGNPWWPRGAEQMQEQTH